MNFEKIKSFFSLENLKTVFNPENLKKAWKAEWTPIALAVAGVVLLLIIVGIVKKCIRSARRRKMRRKYPLGYDPQDIPVGGVGLALQFFLCGAALAWDFFDRD